MAHWPYHCAPPVVTIERDGDGRPAVHLTWWRERLADANKLAPLNRAVFTYATFGQPPAAPFLPASRLAGLLAANDDAARMDGTCLAASDATLSVMTTAYHPAGTQAAAADFGPCVERPVEAGIDSEVWFEPVSYDAHGWKFRFGVDTTPPAAAGNCSLRYDARRELNALPATLSVVELGSTVSCATAYCAREDEPLTGYAADNLMARVSQWAVDAEGRLVPVEAADDVAFAPASATARALSASSHQVLVTGEVTVRVDSLRPGPAAAWVEDLGPPQPRGAPDSMCTIVFGQWYRLGARWAAPASLACLLPGLPTGEPVVLRRRVALASQPSGAWVRGATRTLRVEVTPEVVDGPPAAVLRPVCAGCVQPLVYSPGDSLQLRGAAADAADEAFWSTAVRLPLRAVEQADPRLGGEPGTAGCAGGAVGASHSGPGVAVLDSLPDREAPARAAFCADITLAALRPTAAGGYWPAWERPEPATWFSANGTYRALSIDGSAWYVSQAPVWMSGQAVVGCDPAVPGAGCSPPGAYPFENAGSLADSRPEWQLAVGSSQWVGLRTGAAAPAPGRSVEVDIPVAAPDAPSESPSMEWANVTLVAVLAVLVAANCAAAAYAVWGCLRPGRAARYRGAGVSKSTVRAAAAVMMPVIVAAAATCTEAQAAAKALACASCAGVLSASTCVCACGYSSAEVLLYGLLGFPAVLMLLLYV